jgi:2-polyprenyl-3-methyl-5-hydroxy-6-metoxy-1,4-benzoquinol methylase
VTVGIKASAMSRESAVYHGYYRSKSEALEGLLRVTDAKTVLDVGAGTGSFSLHSLADSAATEAWSLYRQMAILWRMGKISISAAPSGG